MKIAIMAESIGQKMTGQGRVALNIITYLLKNNKNIDLTIIGSEYLKSLDIDTKKIIYNRQGPVEKISNYIKLVNNLNKEKIDLIHCPSNYGPPYFWFLKTNKVRTIYDASGPEMYKVLHHTRQIRLQINFKCLGGIIDRVATISKSSKTEIVEHFGFNDDKIDVIYLGVDEKFKPLDRSNCKKII